MGNGSFPGGKERPGRDADPSPTSSAVGHERVELYLYSPYGPYGLNRASVPVQRWPLPLPFTLIWNGTKMGPVGGELLQAEWQTDWTKPMVAFPDFTNAATGDVQKYWEH